MLLGSGIVINGMVMVSNYMIYGSDWCFVFVLEGDCLMLKGNSGKVYVM